MVKFVSCASSILARRGVIARGSSDPARRTFVLGTAAMRSSFFLKELLDEPFVGGLESRPLLHYLD